MEASGETSETSSSCDTQPDRSSSNDVQAGPSMCSDPQPGPSRPQSGPSRAQATPSTSAVPAGSLCSRRDPLRGRTPSFLAGNYKGLGHFPAKGESFCSCAVMSQNSAAGYRYLDCGCGEDGSVIEWHWDKESKSTAAEVLADGKSVRFHVNYSCGTAAVRGNMPMTDGQYFWEIKMTAPVYGTDMMIGIGTDDVDLDAFSLSFCSMLGRNSDSWGFSYMGNVLHKGVAEKYGARFGQGSIIGVYLNMWHGTLSFYKNRKPLGIAFQGLQGKKLYPMVSSTAAQSGMKLIQAVSFTTSLQFMCCQVLRKLVPLHQDVCDALILPPGLRDFLVNNLSWLLQPCLPPDKDEVMDKDGEEDAGSPASTVDIDTDSDMEELDSDSSPVKMDSPKLDSLPERALQTSSGKHSYNDAVLSNAEHKTLACNTEGNITDNDSYSDADLSYLDASNTAENISDVTDPQTDASDCSTVKLVSVSTQGSLESPNTNAKATKRTISELCDTRHSDLQEETKKQKPS